MNQRAIWAIIRKDMKVIRQSKAVLIPLIVVPFLLLVLLPGIGGILLANTNPASEEIQDFRDEIPGTVIRGGVKVV